MLVVLLQQGKGGGMGAAFGGGAAAQVFGGRGAGNFLTRATAICAAIFMLTSVSLAYLSSSGDRALKATRRRGAAQEEGRRGDARPKDAEADAARRRRPTPRAPAPSGPSARSRRRPSTPRRERGSRTPRARGRSSRDARGSLVALKVGDRRVRPARGFTHVSDDDYARVVIARAFAHAPHARSERHELAPLPFLAHRRGDDASLGRIARRVARGRVRARRAERRGAVRRAARGRA